MIEFVRFKVPFEHLAKKPREITILLLRWSSWNYYFCGSGSWCELRFSLCRLHVLQLSESDSNPVALKSLSSQPEDSVQQPSRFFRQLAKETLKPSISPANHVSWSVSTKQRRQISKTNKTNSKWWFKVAIESDQKSSSTLSPKVTWNALFYWLKSQ